MARTLVTEAMRRRLAELRNSNAVVQGILLVPRMAENLESWEAVSVPQQERLIAEARDDPRFADVEPEPVMTDQQERVFRQQMEATRQQGKRTTAEQRAARAYAKAIGIYR